MTRDPHHGQVPAPRPATLGGRLGRPGGGGAGLRPGTLDGDGQLDDATAATVSRTYTTKGTTRVTVRVTDSFGATSTASVTVTVKPGKR